MVRKSTILVAALAVCCASTACDLEAETGGAQPPDPGALIAVSLSSKVGVVLDEVPASMRDRAAAAYLAKPSDFWLERAKNQLRYATYRLVFRQGFFPEKMQLPLPPEEIWSITLDEQGPVRETANGHDTIVVSYQFKSTLLSDADSPTLSEPALGTVGAVWDEPFVFPVDPELLFQRTGYACMDEYEFPKRSVDSENPRLFFDYDCDVETVDTLLCHTAQTLATQSCRDALDEKVGRVDFAIRYERLAWDDGLAAAVRIGDITPGGADLRPRGDTLADARVTYRYVPPNDCAIAEACVGGPGFRRLLQFGAAAHNLGDAPVHIGEIDFFLGGDPSDSTDHHVYEYSACHDHYHFTHYGSFLLDAGAQQSGGKRAFCLLSTDRFSNNESTPLASPYSDCIYQGIQAGWGDEYFAGLDCQWLDITDIDTSGGPVSASLSFHMNPDGFLCEGTPVTDAEGHPTWEPTEFTTEDGEPVDRLVCDSIPSWDANNERSRSLILPQAGGMVVEPCTRGQLGPLRNCGLDMVAGTEPCTPGTEVTLSCSALLPDVPQVVRICESSAVIGAVPCTEADALENVIVEGASAAVVFTCPPPRDGSEVGGVYGVYAGPVLTEDGPSRVTCVPAP